ncbi:MAG: excinuclease ABC subunit UvrB [Chitinivibrionales bacterium]|nr:excinuclease ABC subunit UvrB [Chitinivibrionales bacterium]MBD3394307.1 excinuclease ABC subunit UvrB [Chitinivibrionales bacterium]
MDFKLHTDFAPTGDQPDAIRDLVEGIRRENRYQTLLGVTGSGKTFTMANVIEQVRLPTLVISHNKTLAAQLYQEFKSFFPENAVEYFVSFYDYYQPEAYLPSTDTYIEKSSDINEEIDRLRLRATNALMSRRDVIIVASVSCIYNIGSPETYGSAAIHLAKGRHLDRDLFFRRLFRMQYTRNDTSPVRSTYRVRGDVIEVYPAYEEIVIRIATFGDEIESIARAHLVTGAVLEELDEITIFPAKHYTTTRVGIEDAIAVIQKELGNQLASFEKDGKLVEAQRLKQRTLYDIEMLREVGYVSGIENYSRILEGREPGSRPFCLLDHFTPPFLTIVDESHVTVPQIEGMYNGDRARKQTLVEHGFRIPCALDNRPLTFGEFQDLADQVVFSSATPGDYELEKSEGIIVEQVIRPTGLVDPPVTVLPARNQVDDLIEQLRTVVQRRERALVTTLTKRMAENLAEYLGTLEFKVRYLHSEIDTLERTDILRDLRAGVFDVLIGINLLREGLDLPEVSLVAILDADKEGFLRSTRSLIQIAGRAARNINGAIILYADTVTDSIKKALDETTRRRTKQLEYNRAHGIVPRSIVRKIANRLLDYEEPAGEPELLMAAEEREAYGRANTPAAPEKLDARIAELHNQMMEAAKDLQFEKAAKLRDRIAALENKQHHGP